MKNKRNELILVLMTLVLFLLLAVGSVAPGVAAWVAEVQPGVAQMQNGLDGLLAPSGGGSSNS
jgi:hypothetical protein